MFQFNEFKLRAATPADEVWLKAAIEADDDHRGRVKPAFFTEQLTGRAECMVIEDAEGAPVFAFRMERAIRLHIQFQPATTTEERQRIGAALTEGFLWLREAAQASGFREILFQSTVAPLVRFCSKRFGFTRSTSELVCPIGAPTPQERAEKNAHGVHQPL